MTEPAGQLAAEGEPASFLPAPDAAPAPASGAPQVQVPLAPFPPLSDASASPPDFVAANSSICPDPSVTTAGTPRRFDGLPATVTQPLQARSPESLALQSFTATVPAPVTQ